MAKRRLKQGEIRRRLLELEKPLTIFTVNIIKYQTLMKVWTRATASAFQQKLLIEMLDKQEDIANGLDDEKEILSKEVLSEFPTMHAQATVALWTMLECAVRDSVASWLEAVPGAYQIEAVKKIKISLSEYAGLTLAERHYYVVTKLEEGDGSKLRYGIDRFESLLNVFGLGGAFDKDSKRDLYELSNVRNIIAHQNGKVDRRFTENCPWLKAEIDSQFFVTTERLGRYIAAAKMYARTVNDRMHAPFVKAMQEEFDFSEN